MFPGSARCIKAIALAALLSSVSLTAQNSTLAPMPSAASFSDLAYLADSAPLVIRAQVRKLARLEPGQARGLRPGYARFYIEANTEALIAGSAPMGEALRYLVDLPLDQKGKPPTLKKHSVLLFARAIASRPGELQLIAPDAQLAWDASLDGQLRAILSELVSPAAPPRVTGVREALYVPGNLAGEGETQLFLNTAKGDPAAITVIHLPGAAPQWSVSFSEMLDPGGRPPARETLAWYRLACSLPAALPTGANVSSTAEDRAMAEADYRLVRDQLGPCGRTRQ